MHLVIDGYRGDGEKLASESVLYQLLNELPRAMGMKAISYPQVQHYSGGSKPEDGGLSAFVFIAESHLSFHTFPARGLVWADLFSCKDFDGELALRMVRRAFGLQQVRALGVIRGLERPDYQHHWEVKPLGEPADGQLRLPVPSAPSQT